MKTVLLSSLVALLLIGCGGGGGSSSKPQEYNSTVSEVTVTPTLITLPTYNVSYQGTILPLEIIADRYSYTDLSEQTILVARSVGGKTVDTTFATVLHDLTHDAYIITADITIPFNTDKTSIDHLLSIYYLTSNGTKLIHAIDVHQDSFVEPEVHYTYDISVDMTNAVGDYSLQQDPTTGDVTIVQSPSRLKQDCLDMGWLWNNNVFKCVPPPSSPTYTEVMTCINNPQPPNKWDFVTGACYEQLTPDATPEEACGILGALWDVNTSKCYASQKELTAQEACSDINGTWNATTSECYADQLPTTDLQACIDINGTWNTDTSECYVDQLPITDLEACSAIGGTWNTTTSECYADQLPITDLEACTTLHGDWNTSNNTCTVN